MPRRCLADWSPVIAPAGLFENLSDGDVSNDPLIVSVRAADVYELGHIEGAINIGWKAIATDESLEALPEGAPIVVYCYTGHTGQVAATALTLMGYDVQNLKFGMMGWSDDARRRRHHPLHRRSRLPDRGHRRCVR